MNAASFCPGLHTSWQPCLRGWEHDAMKRVPAGEPAAPKEAGAGSPQALGKAASGSAVQALSKAATGPSVAGKA